jgi:hypothetical protein
LILRRPGAATAGRGAVSAVVRALNLRAASEAPRPSGELFRPHVEGRRYTTSHYNVVIPDLPEPHRFLGCAVFIGRTGTRAFDLDHSVAGSPRRTATLAFGTAATAPNWFSTYSTRDDCVLRADGSLLRFGEDLEIVGRFPEYRVIAHRPGFDLDIDVACAEQITWFARSAVYDHYGFPARYRGTFSWQGEQRPVHGILSLEHARAMTLSAIADRTVPNALKLPCDFFTYHVLAIAPDTLLMLTDVQALGVPVLTTAYVKAVDGSGSRHVHGVSFEVLEMGDEPELAPDGAATFVPSRFRWRITEDDRPTTEIVGTPDTRLIYGLGRGWLGGYRYEGQHRGVAVAGNAYFEYVDRRSDR